MNNTCCFTGHRPKKLNLTEQEIIPLLEKAIDNAIENGYVTFITGMAEGIDVIAAEIVLQKKEKNKNLELICALPHPGFSNKRTKSEKLRYEKIIENADFVEIISNTCSRSCYMKRNIYMVDKSSLVIAVFNGEKGGTKNTVDYAVKNGKRVLNVICF